MSDLVLDRRPSAGRPTALFVAAGLGGHRLAEAVEAATGMATASSSSREELLAAMAGVPPDVVFVGESASEGERLAICRVLRGEPRLAGTPILVVADPGSERFVEALYEAGASDVVYAPVHRAVLVRRLANHVNAGRAMIELEASRAGLEQARRTVGFETWNWNLDTGAIECSEDLAPVLGLKAFDSAAPPALDALLQTVPAGDASRVRGELDRACRDGGSYSLEHPVRLRGGLLRTIRHEGRVLVNLRGERVLHALLHDCTEQRSAEERIRRLAYYDGLTGLPNVVMFHELLDHALARTRRGGDALAALLVDLNGFKHVTSRFGRQGGETVLTEVAARLLRYVRRGDYVARHTMNAAVARHGGDRFALMLTDVEEVDDVARVARRILGAVAEPIRCRSEEIFVTASVGISVSPEDGADVDTLVRNAETALHCAKRNGRNTFHFFSTNMNRELVQRFDVETKLRRALERDELLLYYQPLMDVRTGNWTALEALVRWQHPDMGLVLPGEFIPIAEDSDLIHPLGEWVLRNASLQVKRWGVPWRLAVNISSQQLGNPRFVEGVVDVLRETGFPPDQLELELTESGVLRNSETTRHKLQRLKDLGVRLAVDDFGTGYSALSYLRDFPLDTLKIDRSFVGCLESTDRNGTLIAAMISMAHHLGLRVIGEGVETEEQLRFLIDNGCDEAQGFLIGRPRDATAYGAMEKHDDP